MKEINIMIMNKRNEKGALSWQSERILLATPAFKMWQSGLKIIGGLFDGYTIGYLAILITL